MEELEEGSAGEIADPALTPEESIIKRQGELGYQKISEAMARAIAGLPEDVRLYLRYRIYSEPPLKPREIAAVMGRTESEIHALAAKAKTKLAAALKDLKNDPLVKSWLETV